LHYNLEVNKDEKVDAYIAGFDEPLRTKLREIRTIIRRAAPQASEVFSNDMPGYVLHDNLVWFAAAGGQVAFYPRGYHFKKVYAAELAGYKTPKGAIHFPAEAPLPAKLITKIVKDRANENRLVSKPSPAGIPAKIGAPALRALAVAKITSLADLASYSQVEILALHGIGPSALPLLRAALHKVGLEFRRDDKA
jgi:uncharacterized protein YdhG (YjbR/CyaY superfamily)